MNEQFVLKFTQIKVYAEKMSPNLLKKIRGHFMLNRIFYVRKLKNKAFLFLFTFGCLFLLRSVSIR